MPFKSKAQHRLFRAKEERGEMPKGTASRWAHHTSSMSKLPEHVKHKKESGDIIADLAVGAACSPYVERLAADSGLPSSHIAALAAFSQIPVVSFCKQAYENPQAFTELNKLVTEKQGNWLTEFIKRRPISAAAGGLGLGSLGAGSVYMATRGSGDGSPSGGWSGSPAGSFWEGLGQPNSGTGGPFWGNLERSLRPGHAEGGTAAQSRYSGLGDIFTPMSNSLRMLERGSAGQQQIPGTNINLGSTPGRETSRFAEQVPGAGMDPRLKALLLAGGVGLGGYGLYRLLRGRRRDKESVDKNLNPVARVIKKAAQLKLAHVYKKAMTDHFIRYLDTLAARLPLNKQASVRHLQADVGKGTSLVVAIKRACPELSGEERGILASRLCKGASQHFFRKQADHGELNQNQLHNQLLTNPVTLGALGGGVLGLGRGISGGAPVTGTVRGVGRGMMAGGGLAGGAALGDLLGRQLSPDERIHTLLALAGSGLGAVGGATLAGKLMGKGHYPKDEKDKDKTGFDMKAAFHNMMGQSGFPGVGLNTTSPMSVAGPMSTSASMMNQMAPR
jgi:hypothetical protein